MPVLHQKVPSADKKDGQRDKKHDDVEEAGSSPINKVPIDCASQDKFYAEGLGVGCAGHKSGDQPHYTEDDAGI